MQERIERMFEEKKGGRTALIAYATAYYPDRQTSLEAVKKMLDSGADAVELGVPFSDPVMDGPVIQESSRVAREAGSSLEGVLGIAEEVRSGTDKPIFLMSYYNPVFKYGLRAFAREAVKSGLDAVVIPDLPAEEMRPLKEACDEAGLRTVAFCSVTTTDERIGLASDMTSGFLYCVSILGTTGERRELPSELEGFIDRVRSNSDCPLALGIGISTPEQCKAAGKLVDGVIVGSALVRALTEGGIEELGSLVSRLALR